MSGQNRSSAVMQQRSEARDAFDDFPTPPWATRAMLLWLQGQGHNLAHLVAREPCANRGYMVLPLREFFGSVVAGDVFDYGAGYPVVDYLFGPLPDHTDWTCMNPPFRLAQQFIDRALATSGSGVAVFVRSAFLEGGARHKELFAKNPPTAILQFAERVVIHKGVLRKRGEKYWDPNAKNGKGKPKGKMRAASSATAYCWLIWEERGPLDEGGTAFHWIPPCSEKLELPSDYDGGPVHAV